MKNFITPQELVNIQKNVVILDVRGDKAYAAGHIEGAFVVNLAGDLSGPVEEHGGRHPLPNMVEFAKKMERFGITKDSTVVICDRWIFSRSPLVDASLYRFRKCESVGRRH